MEKQELNSIDMIQMHPYEYLTELNSIYASCNKANVKSSSSASKKLMWKPFNIVKIPKCFEVTYTENKNMEKKQNEDEESSMDDGEKKIWKEHQEILKRYAKGKEENRKMLRPKTAANGKKLIEQILPFSLNRGNNFFLKKIAEKGAKFQYKHEEVKIEVLKKLKNLNETANKNKSWRIQSAVPNRQKQNTSTVNEIRDSQNYYNIKKGKNYGKKERSKPEKTQYLVYQRSEDIVSAYKQKIKQVDCSISQFNIRKTVSLLRNMENMANNLE